MKIEAKRIILSCVFLCLVFVLNTDANAQLRSIMLSQRESTHATQLPQDVQPSPATKQLVMQANQPSNDSSVLAASHVDESESLKPAASVTMIQLDEAQYGSPIAPGVAVFEVKNFGTEDASDVYVEIAVENSARMLSIEPETTIIASKAARVHLGSMRASQSRMVKVHAASGNGKPVQYTTRVVLESEPQFVSSDSRRAALPVNPFPRNPQFVNSESQPATQPAIPFPRNPLSRESQTQESVTREPVTQEPETQEPETQEPETQEPVAYEPKSYEPVAQGPTTQESKLSEPEPGNVITNEEPSIDAKTDELHGLNNEVAAKSMNPSLAPEEPLVIKVEAPKQFILGVPYRVYATVQNPTSSAISNVQISLKSSAHLRSTTGFASFQTVPKLASRHAARFEFEVFGVKPGNAELFFGGTAKFDGDKETEIVDSTNSLIQLGSSEIIEVYKPAIRAKFNGPEFVHVGTEATYGIEVINESGSPLATTDVLLNVPEHMIVTVLDRIAYKRSDGQIRWRVENLEPGKSELIQFKAKATRPGMQTQQAELAIQNRVFAQSTCDTNILGPSKLQVELRDLYAAVPIGEVAKLKINIINQDDYDNELQLKISLPEAVHAVNSENLQSNDRNEVLFKPLVVNRNSTVTLEIPLVGSVIGGQAIQATVTSNTTFISRTTNRVVIFVNPQDAQYGGVADIGPPMKAEPVVPSPVLTELPDPVASVTKSLDAARVSARPASEFSSAMLSSSRISEINFQASTPDLQHPNGQQDSFEPTTSLEPNGYSETEIPESNLKRGLPARIRPLIASRRTSPDDAYNSSTPSAHSNVNRRQPDATEPSTLPSSTEPQQPRPASRSILINRR